MEGGDIDSDHVKELMGAEEWTELPEEEQASVVEGRGGGKQLRVTKLLEKGTLL